MRCTAPSADRVRLVIDGHSFLAEPCEDTVVFTLADNRPALTSRTSERPIELFTVEDDEEAVEAEKLARVQAAAKRPRTPRSQRPSERVKAERALARERHQAVWLNGHWQGQADHAARPLRDRVTEADLGELTTLAMSAVLCDPELRRSFMEACAGAEVAELEAAAFAE